MLRPRCVRSPGTVSSSSSIASSLAWARRFETTGEHHTFRPGPITKALRVIFRLITPKAAVKRIAMRMQVGMEKVEGLEREHRWLKMNGSPLAVLGLPEHAELQEVRTKYRDLVLDLHPDTAGAKSSSADGSLQVENAAYEAARRAEDYERMQTAYKMLTNPDSLFYQSGSAQHLHDELMLANSMNGKKKRRFFSLSRRISIFALISLSIGMLFVVIVAFDWFERFLLELLAFIDPDFYAYFVEAEKEEKRLEALGMVVDKNPKRFAPTRVQKMLSPGSFLKRIPDEEMD